MNVRHRLASWPSLLLAALLTVLAAGTVSASAAHGPETRVRAIPTATATAVGPQGGETAGGVGCLRPPDTAIASGSCVATNPAAGSANLMGSGEDFATYAGRAAPEPGYTDVIAHSDGNVFSATPDGPTFDHRVLAGAVEGSPGYSGGPIRLLACDTGACNASGAQNLANKIGVDVLAPTEKVWALPNGQLVVAANYSPTSGFSGMGSWKTFSPGG